MLKNVAEIRKELEQVKTRSKWAQGVKDYAFDLVDTLEEWQYWENIKEIPPASKLEEVLLNGAKNWKEYSWGGCSLCYNYDIAKRLCTPSELKKTYNGGKRPNAREDWLDVQYRAIVQAYLLIKNIIYKGGEEVVEVC